MREGSVVLSAFQQADGKIKNRPALILRAMPPFGDFLVCGISRQVHHAVADVDELIVPGDDDFKESHLAGPSVIRLGFLAVIPRKDLLGEIGRVSAERHRRLLEKLANFLIRFGT